MQKKPREEEKKKQMLVEPLQLNQVEWEPNDNNFIYCLFPKSSNPKTSFAIKSH